MSVTVRMSHVPLQVLYWHSWTFYTKLRAKPAPARGGTLQRISWFATGFAALRVVSFDLDLFDSSIRSFHILSAST